MDERENVCICTLLLTVLPLFYTWMNMLFILSQVMGKDAKAGMMATVGVCTGLFTTFNFCGFGYCCHCVSFHFCLKPSAGWAFAYLLYLAFGFIKVGFSTKKLQLDRKTENNPIKKSFLPHY